MNYFPQPDDQTQRRGGAAPWDTTQALPAYDSPYYDERHARTSPYPPMWQVPAPPPLPPTYPNNRPPRRKRHRARNVLATLALIVVALTLLNALAHSRRQSSAAGPNAAATALPAATSTPAPTFAATLLDNNVGVSDDSDFRSGNLDSWGNSFSAQALAAAKLIPGSAFVYDGVAFTWPAAAPGTADDMQVQQQQVDVAATTPFTTVAFLGASHFGASQCTITLSYADGTTQSAQLGFSDWTIGWGGVQYGNAIVATMPYHNNGLQSHVAGKTYIFYAKIALQPHKILKSIAFPKITSLSQMHIFSIGAK